MSQDLRSLMQAAEAAHQSGRLDQAEVLCNRILSLRPKFTPARLTLGVVAAKTDQVPLAIDSLRRVLRDEPSNYVALNWLAMVLRDSGQVAEATTISRQAVAQRPNDPDANNNLGLCFLFQQRYEEALGCFTKALAARPNFGFYLYGMSSALEGLGRDGEAFGALKEAVRLAPTEQGLLKLGAKWLDIDEIERAIECGSAAIEKAPNSIPSLLFMAKALDEANRTEEAERCLQRILEIQPDNSDAYIERALRCQSRGRFDDAVAEYAKAIETNPSEGSAYWGLVSAKKITEADRPFIAAMESKVGQLPANEALNLAYALGKAYDDLGEYEKAIGYLDKANRLTRSVFFHDQPFDKKGFQAQVDEAIRLFTPLFIESQRGSGSESDLPIIVCGMIRSGTTLVEQILSCHPDVGAAGERGFWLGWEPLIVQKDCLKTDVLTEAIGKYHELLQSVAPGKPHVTEKNPPNFLVLGLIHIAFPQARIIHLRRNPADTFMSIYMTPIQNPPPFYGDRDSIVFAYEQYLRIVDHWRAVLPANRFLDVDYEALVADRERVTRKLFEFLGLSWDDACLRPQDNPRRVMTPSIWQVRQPVYTSSVDRWKRYEPWLGVFGKFKD